jgi:hypothetical protein
MAYAATNPPRLMSVAVPGGRHWWHYESEDIHTAVDETDYFTNGHALGMRVNDIVAVVKTTATIGVTWHVVTASTAGGAATVAPAILA